ncbi:MAG: PAS domain S-box protein [Chloroflexi bacterium]|nr:PAS domain S-box protein [Chloroflexota bacterium]
MDEDKKFKVRFEDLFSELSDSPAAQEDVPTPLEEPVEQIIKTEQTKESEDVFRVLAENALDAIFISDIDGAQTYSNRACYEIFGYDYAGQEMNGLPLSNLWPEENASVLANQVLAQAVNGKWNGEIQQKRKDGTLFDAHLTMYAVQDEADQTHNIVTVIRDISERKQLEQKRAGIYEHRARQVQLTTEVAQEIAAAPTMDQLYQRVVTLVKGQFGYRYVRLFCYDPKLDAIVLVKERTQAGDQTQSADSTSLPATGVVNTAATTGQPVLIADVFQESQWTPHPNLPDTKSELAMPIKLRDRVLGVLDVHSDAPGDLTREDEIVLLNLTSQIAMAMESTRLLEEANAFRQFAKASEGVSWFTLQDHIVIYANPALSTLLGVTKPEDTFGKPITIYYPEELRDRVQNEILPTVMQTGHWVGELAYLSAQGKVTPTMQSIFLIRDESGTPLYLSNVATDITEQKQAEFLLDKRTKQIRCLNDLGQKIEETPQLPEFLQWVAERIPSAMQYQDLCIAAMEFRGQIYGKSQAMDMPSQIVENLRIDGEAVGRICIAYTRERDFISEETTLLNDVVRRVNRYIESRYLLEQTQTTLDEMRAAHRLYMPEQWDELPAVQAPPEEHVPQDEAASENLDELQDHDEQGKRIGTTLREKWQRISTGLFVFGALLLLEKLFTWPVRI